jgi:methionyl-tRNA formyltransferase
MRIVFFGTPHFAVPSLQALIEHPEMEVLGIVTQPDKRRGRGNQVSPSPVKELALREQLPIWQPKSLKKNKQTLALLQDTQADFFVVVAYGQLLSAEILSMPKNGCINVHGSLLPQYRGAAPIQWSIYNGDTETGITTMLMNEGMDTGDILLKSSTPIQLLDNAYHIADILSRQGAEILIETLVKIQKGQITPIPQEQALATYAPLIGKTDYQINWQRSSLEIHNQVRGFYPNCGTSFRGQGLKVMATLPLDLAYQSQLSEDLQRLGEFNGGEIGEIVAIVKNWGAVVQTGSGFLLLSQVQLAGKRPQSGTDFVNGARVTVAEKMV